MDSNYTAASAGSPLSLNKNTSSYNFGTNVVLEDGTTTLNETSFNEHPSKALFSYTLGGSKKAEMSRSHEWTSGDLKDKTVTGIVITGYENGTLAWADAKDPTQRTASAPVSANVKIWNVEDTPMWKRAASAWAPCALSSPITTARSTPSS